MIASGLYVYELLKNIDDISWPLTLDVSNEWAFESNTEGVSLFSPGNGCVCLLSWDEIDRIQTDPNGLMAHIICSLMSIKVQLPLPHKKFVIMPILGNGCESNCQYCFVPPGIERQGVKDLDMLYRFIDMEDQKCEAHIDFSGNLSQYSLAILISAENLKLRLGERVSFSVQTIGGDLDQETIRQLSQRGFSFGVSFDGTPTLHDFHRLQSSYTTISLLRFIIDSGYPYLVRCTVSRSSIEQMNSMWSFMESLGIRNIILNKLRPPGIPSTLGIPTESEWLAFYEEWFNQSWVNDFPRLCDDTILKWLNRLGSNPTGWSNMCSTAWCETKCQIRVLSRSGKDIQCARFWAHFPENDIDSSCPEYCTTCICRFHCGGGCRIERGHSVEHKVMCSQKRWIFYKLLRIILSLPQANLFKFGFVEVPGNIFSYQRHGSRHIPNSQGLTQALVMRLPRRHDITDVHGNK